MLGGASPGSSFGVIPSGLFAVPAYEFALYHAQENGISPTIASLTTVLTPLFIVLLSASLLGARLTCRKTFG